MMVENAINRVVTATITAEEARILTDQIKGAAVRLWTLLLEAHERRAWQALGYSSFVAYVKAEFDIGQSHAYRLLDQGRVVRALEQVAGSPIGEISECVARDIKPNLELVVSDVQERIAGGEEPAAAIQAAIGAVRQTTYLTSKKRADRDNRYIETLVLEVTSMLDAATDHPIDFVHLDASRCVEWAAGLRTAAQGLKRLADRIDRAVKHGDGRRSAA